MAERIGKLGEGGEGSEAEFWICVDDEFGEDGEEKFRSFFFPAQFCRQVITGT